MPLRWPGTKKSKEIPKCLHAVWLGGLLRPQGKTNLEAWRKKNPDYQLKLWIDSSLYHIPDNPPSAQATESKPPAKKSWRSKIFGKKTKSDYPEKYGKEYQQLIELARKNKITLCDVAVQKKEISSKISDVVEAKFGFLNTMPGNQYYNDEINGQYRNYAAASDILRLGVLQKEGGIYFDCEDVLPGEKALGSLKPTHGFLLHSTDTYTINNDLIAATPGHEFITQYLEQVCARYAELYIDPLKLAAHRNDQFTGSGVFNDENSRKISTMQLSGPSSLSDFINTQGLDDKVYTTETCRFNAEHYQKTPQQAASWYDPLVDTKKENFPCFARNHIRAHFNALLDERKEQLTASATTDSIKELIELEKFRKKLNSLPPSMNMDGAFSSHFNAEINNLFLEDLRQQLGSASKHIEAFILHIAEATKRNPESAEKFGQALQKIGVGPGSFSTLRDFETADFSSQFTKKEFDLQSVLEQFGFPHQAHNIGPRLTIGSRQSHTPPEKGPRPQSTHDSEA